MTLPYWRWHSKTILWLLSSLVSDFLRRLSIIVFDWTLHSNNSFFNFVTSVCLISCNVFSPKVEQFKIYYLIIYSRQRIFVNYWLYLYLIGTNNWNFIYNNNQAWNDVKIILNDGSDNQNRKKKKEETLKIIHYQHWYFNLWIWWILMRYVYTFYIRLHMYT